MNRSAFLSLLLLPALAMADTTWVAPGNVSGIWSAEHSPYMIQESIFVDSVARLEIDSGAVCRFAELARLTVVGELYTHGAPGDSILFSTLIDDSSQTWAGMVFHRQSDAALNYCIIERTSPDQSPGSLEVSANSLRMNHSTVRDCQYRTIWLYPTGQLFVDHCAFIRNTAPNPGRSASVLFANGGFADIRNSLFSGNRGQDGAAINLASNSWLTLDRCVFRDNEVAAWGGAIVGTHGNLLATRCTFVGNQATMGSHILMITESTLSLNSCIFAFSRNIGGAFYVDEPVQQIRNCAIYGNDPVFQGGSGPTGFQTLDHVNQRGDSCDVYANIFLDPMFADTSSDLLDVLTGSPCIDAGDSSLSYDEDGSPPDIGAIPKLRSTTWTTIQFPGGFAAIGCPCAYPFLLPTGSLVRLRRDLTHDGPTSDDLIAGSFSISTGAGLPPWDGVWTPRPDSQLVVDSFYVELLTGTCCWRSGMLRIAGGDTVLVDSPSWSCQESATGDGCLSAAASLVNRDFKQLGSVPTLAPVSLLAAPNPFNVTTEFRFTLHVAARVELIVFDITGRRVAELARGELDSGSHRRAFDGTNLATGLYFVRFRAGSQIMTSKLLLLK